jgi:hypothetical protein
MGGAGAESTGSALLLMTHMGFVDMYAVVTIQENHPTTTEVIDVLLLWCDVVDAAGCVFHYR